MDLYHKIKTFRCYAATWKEDKHAFTFIILGSQFCLLRFHGFISKLILMKFGGYIACILRKDIGYLSPRKNTEFLERLPNVHEDKEII